MPETANKVFESLNLEISLEEDYARLLEKKANLEIFEDVKIEIDPNSESKPIFERLTEDKEEEIKRLF